jgi:ubiquinone/menaquinone biosynthesis C-methylase UbiE
MPSLEVAKLQVPGEFDRVARAYDTLTLLNPGYNRHLRISARRLGIGATTRGRILDLCCGTGLSTRALLDEYPRAAVVALDASEGMLEVARRKPALAGVELVHGDAGNPAAAGVEGPFDAALMAYGIRNLPDPDTGLANLRALIRPGGVVAFHEYSVADSRWGTLVWRAVSTGVIIPLGGALAGSADLFRYLRRSVLEFDGAREFCARLERSGFIDVRVLPMGGWQRGVVHTFLARVPQWDN